MSSRKAYYYCWFKIFEPKSKPESEAATPATSGPQDQAHAAIAAATVHMLKGGRPPLLPANMEGALADMLGLQEKKGGRPPRLAGMQHAAFWEIDSSYDGDHSSGLEVEFMSVMGSREDAENWLTTTDEGKAWLSDARTYWLVRFTNCFAE